MHRFILPVKPPWSFPPEQLAPPWKLWFLGLPNTNVAAQGRQRYSRSEQNGRQIPRPNAPRKPLRIHSALQKMGPLFDTARAKRHALTKRAFSTEFQNIAVDRRRIYSRVMEFESEPPGIPPRGVPFDVVNSLGRGASEARVIPPSTRSDPRRHTYRICASGTPSVCDNASGLGIVTVKTLSTIASPFLATGTHSSTLMRVGAPKSGYHG